MIQVSIEEAYREAVTALGEAFVRERLLMAQIAKLEAERTPDTPNNVPAMTD